MVKPAGSGIYRLWLEPEVHDIRGVLPGKIRQQIKRLIDSLSVQPKPSRSQVLDVEGLAIPEGMEIRRIRLENWRIIYAIHEQERWIWILAIRKRPPYKYEDLDRIISRLES